MKTFRQKYLYNPENPIYSSPTCRTYNCLNTETKNKRLVLIQHLQAPVFVEPAPNILQPVEIPTAAQPFSVYPLVRCVSEIQRIGEADAMYVIKCVTECKIKQPLYSVISEQGICCSEVEGILPNQSPSAFELLCELLGLDQDLRLSEGTVLSKDGMAICKALKKGDSIGQLLVGYGWKDIKKEKDLVTDADFIIFRGRRKEEGPFGDEYALAWNNQLGLAKMKYISLTKDGYEEHFIHDYMQVIQYIKSANPKVEKKNRFFMDNIRFVKQARCIKIFTELSNQGSLSEYITARLDSGYGISEDNAVEMLDKFVVNMLQLSQELRNGGIGNLHIRNVAVHNNSLCLGEFTFISDSVEKKLRDNKNNMDYYAPELKQDIILVENLQKHSKQKMDIWFFGFMLHKVLARELPIFDPSKKPLINRDKISPAVGQLIGRCLDLNAGNRPSWAEVSLRELVGRVTKHVVVEDMGAEQQGREQIRLGSRLEKKSEKPKSPEKKYRAIEQLEEENLQKQLNIQEQDRLRPAPLPAQPEPLIPAELSSKLRKLKLSLKLVTILCLYIFVFFRPFLFTSIAIIQVRSNYAPINFHLVDNSNTRLSTTTILTDNPLFFMNNDISFDSLQNKYQCINDNFDPVNNPSYSLMGYVQSGSFLALLMTGWVAVLVMCVTKGVSMWRGGISNRPDKGLPMYLLSYGFHEVCFAALLFAHFYVYQFFYFGIATPCLGISNFMGLEPFFDSSLYLFLSNSSSYFQQVFSTVGILALLLLLSNCFHAWGPKKDQKYFVSFLSIIFRIVPFVLFLLICRVGVFALFSPTAINDATQLIPKIMGSSFQGFLGFVPEIFVCVCVVVEILIEIGMHWCERKAASSDRLARLFNIRGRKRTADNDTSRINENEGLDQSKHRLQASMVEQS